MNETNTTPAAKTYETLSVLAGAYKASNPKSLLTHVVESVDGRWSRVLCSKRVQLDNMCDFASDEDKAKYATFYGEFGAVLKEGLGEDVVHRERLAKLLRFASTASDSVSVSLAVCAKADVANDILAARAAAAMTSLIASPQG